MPTYFLKRKKKKKAAERAGMPYLVPNHLDNVLFGTTW